jgi:hypothetical protein
LLDRFLDNLLSPPILFFCLGIAATLVRSDLKVPEPISKLFSLYLLWAIGLKGGVALAKAGFEFETLLPVGVAIGLSIITPITLLPILRARFGLNNATAIAASYGSVSVVTFLAAVDFLEGQGIEYGGEMVAALALMESPPIIVALLLRRLLERDRSSKESMGHLLHSAITSGPVFLLLGSLLAGVLTGPERFEPLSPFCDDIFEGVLVLFLLDGGIVAGARLKGLRVVGFAALVCAIVVPLCSAAVAITVSTLLGMPRGNALLLTILAASASYIAVPAVMRLSVPQANAGLYLPMSLGITFPFNVCIGIPLYLMIIEALRAQ